MELLILAAIMLFRAWAASSRIKAAHIAAKAQADACEMNYRESIRQYEAARIA